MMQNLMQRFGGMGGMGGGAPQPPPPSDPKLGEVCKIVSNSHLQKIISDYSAVIVDFWSP